MTLLVIGVLLWTVVHLVPTLARPFRQSMISRLGENGYKGVFSLVVFSALLEDDSQLMGKDSCGLIVWIDEFESALAQALDFVPSTPGIELRGTCVCHLQRSLDVACQEVVMARFE